MIWFCVLQQHLKLVQSRDEDMASLSRQLRMEGYKAPFQPETARQFLSEVNRKVRESDEKARQEKVMGGMIYTTRAGVFVLRASMKFYSLPQLHFSQKDEELQKEINELRTNLAQIEQALKMRQKTVAENQEKMVAIGRKLSALGSGGSALDSIQKDLTATVRHEIMCNFRLLVCVIFSVSHTKERELEEVKAQTNIPKMEASHSALRSEKKKVDEEISRLQQELSVISRQSSSRGALEALRRDKRDKEERYQTE